MATTEIVARNIPRQKLHPVPRAKQHHQIGFDPVAFASTKRNSKLLTVVEEVRSELQNGDSDQVRAYLFAICFRKLLNAARTQFEAEESLGYLPFEVSRFDSQALKTAGKLRDQHATLLASIQDMLDLAEEKIKQTYREDGLNLLNRFWNLQRALRQHEEAELKLIDAARSPSSHRTDTRSEGAPRKRTKPHLA